MRVVVIGARGMLGAATVREFAAHHEVVALDRSALDVTDDEAVARVVGSARPDVIVNCSAYNAVDGAEDEPVAALQVNALAVRALARAARAADAILVHYSSDFVFDGTASTPYTEDDSPNPRSTYAVSKLLGEWFAMDAPHAFVLRVESLFGVVPGMRARGSIEGIVQTLRSGGVPTIFEDRTVSPTSILDAARVTRELAERRAAPGLYHCVNSGWCTWLELAQETARVLGVEPRFTVARFADTTFRASRPMFCALSNEKLTSLGIEMPLWRDALRRDFQGR